MRNQCATSGDVSQPNKNHDNDKAQAWQQLLQILTHEIMNSLTPINSLPTLRLHADEGQLEQVMLALVRNAEAATADEPAPKLWVDARQSRGGRLHSTLRDNGAGVPAGMERQIFLPFFSTRQDGQGIGLTVVRQLMYGMGWRVRHVRLMERGAAFVLIF